jgi:hypothetical protein
MAQWHGQPLSLPLVQVKSFNAPEGGLYTDAPTRLEIRKEAGILVTNGHFIKGDHNIVVEYTYGYAETPAAAYHVADAQLYRVPGRRWF